MSDDAPTVYLPKLRPRDFIDETAAMVVAMDAVAAECRWTPTQESERDRDFAYVPLRIANGDLTLLSNQLFADPMQFKQALQRIQASQFLEAASGAEGSASGALSTVSAQVDNGKTLEVVVESEFHQLVRKLQRSSLFTLKAESRVDVPARKRPEMNFMVTRERLYHTLSATPMTPDALLDAVISVAFYARSRPSVRSQEFQILASQALEQMTDLIDCSSGEIETAIIMEQEEASSQPAFLIINGDAFVDYRTGADYETCIAEYKRDTGKAINRIRSAVVAFSKLELRVGERCTYVHHGSCEHTFIVTDIHLVSALNDDDIHKYPRAFFRSKIARIKCRMCGFYPAEFVTIDDVNAGEIPAFFCKHCYDSFHFTQEGQPLCEFKVFPYARADPIQRS